MNMNENLPINMGTEREAGTVTFANEVIAIIAGMAANEVDGVASMINSNTIADLFGRAKPVTKGVKVEVGVEEASVDLVMTVEYGKPIHKVCTDVQESVRKAIESMTGLHVVKVDVHVVGVSFEREAKEMQQGYVKATTVAGELDERSRRIEPNQPREKISHEATHRSIADPLDIDTDIPDSLEEDDIVGEDTETPLETDKEE